MNCDKKGRCSSQTLQRELAGFRLTTSRFYPGFSLARILDKTAECRVIKNRDRRQVYHLQTPEGGFFLKRTLANRPKDRWRHLLLPRRRWAEWRNLHRLRTARVAAAGPVLRGETPRFHPKVFFLLTEEVRGCPLKRHLVAQAHQLGRYAAFLHSRGIYHADWHPENILVGTDGRFFLIDAQEVYFLPWLPRRLRIHNLGKLFFHLRSQLLSDRWRQEFISAYSQTYAQAVTAAEVTSAADRHQQRHFRSRTKRCCRNSTEFMVLKEAGWRGFKRRDFSWGPAKLQQALVQGQTVKPRRVLCYEGVCIKVHRRKWGHRDRCRTSWQMSRALEVRGIGVPRALGYCIVKPNSYFLSEFLVDSVLLNDYLSSLADRRQKRRALKRLALWVKKIHDRNIWQQDFKSSNILCRQGEYCMADLDGVKIRRLTNAQKVINLAQLNASLGHAITGKDRLRFFYYYAGDDRLSRSQRRTLYRKVWDITRTKNTAVFGLDIEKIKL
ncbi:MAG: hypothetical protein JSW39_21420 [Desulfobacterales bacterium]|nr:MAG: hypothetical protein JSW39_21420 [Desulfobacterales bacterium]